MLTFKLKIRLGTALTAVRNGGNARNGDIMAKRTRESIPETKKIDKKFTIVYVTQFSSKNI